LICNDKGVPRHVEVKDKGVPRHVEVKERVYLIIRSTKEQDKPSNRIQVDTWLGFRVSRAQNRLERMTLALFREVLPQKLLDFVFK